MNTLNCKNQNHVAGLLPGDPNIEFIGITDTKKVIWLQHGSAHRFEDLAPTNYQILESHYLIDNGAVAYLDNYKENDSPVSLRRKVELYIYYMCGTADGTPDLVNGKLNFSENFRETLNCPSLKFDRKRITIDGVELSLREIKMIDLMKEDRPDKYIAGELLNRDGSKGITVSTYDFHKRNLFQKIGVLTKTALLQKVNQARI